MKVVNKRGGKKFIQSALHPGARGLLRQAAGAKKGQPIPPATIDRLAKMSGKVGQRARFAKYVLLPASRRRGH